MARALLEKEFKTEAANESRVLCALKTIASAYEKTLVRKVFAGPRFSRFLAIAYSGYQIVFIIEFF